MASTPKSRTLRDGTVVWGVQWVVGGGKARAGVARDSATLERENDAIRFKLAVEENGNRWPTRDWTKDEYGYAVTKASLEMGKARDYTAFSDVADKYFAWQAKRVTLEKVKSYTVYRYNGLYKKHMLPYLGEMPFTQIELEDIEEWVIRQKEAQDAGPGNSNKSIRNRHGLLYSIMQYGQNRMKLRMDNPCDNSNDYLPDNQDGIMRQNMFFTPDEWDTFRKCLDPRMHLLCDLMLATGMRCGEIFALQVGDIRINDKDDVSIRIQRAWTKRDKDDKSAVNYATGENMSWKVSTPKSKVARWSNVKGNVAVELIDEISRRDPISYVFTTITGMPIRHPDFLFDFWNPAREQAALERINPTPHMLRHSFVVWALEAGEDLYKVSSAVGHASVQVTQQIYSGFIDPTRNSVADAIRRQMERKVICEDDDDQ